MIQIAYKAHCRLMSARAIRQRERIRCLLREKAAVTINCCARMRLARRHVLCYTVSYLLILYYIILQWAVLYNDIYAIPCYALVCCIMLLYLYSGVNISYIAYQRYILFYYALVGCIILLYCFICDNAFITNCNKFYV